MEPSVTVNGRRPPTRSRSAGTSPCSTGCGPIGLTGSKEGCAEGECGACAVLVARPDGDERSRWTAINACLVPAAGFDGQEVLTAEGLGAPGRLHPVQQEMADRGGSQCGYCTPGFICSMAGEFYRADRRRPAGPSASPPPSRRRNGERPPAARPPTGRPTRPPRRRRRPRARPQRLRPARAERQPVPLHRLPADPGRRVRPAAPGRDDPLREPAASSRRRRPVATQIDSVAGHVRPARRPWPRRSTCSPRARTRGWSPAPPTGASSSTSGTPGPR